MELKLDLSKTYAIALEGGGAKGAYEAGVWKAFEEAGLRYNAVSGTSVGALNGGLMAMRDLDRSLRGWENIRLTDVIRLEPEEEEEFHRLLSEGLTLSDLSKPKLVKDVLRSGRDILQEKGLDVEPLRNWMNALMDSEAILASDVELFVTTVNLTDKKNMEIRIKDLPADEVVNMLLASAYHPTFRQEKLGGKNYADGGFFDTIPIHVLVEAGYKDIIAVRMPGGGIERLFRIPGDVTVHTVEPKHNLGNVLNFDAEQSRRDILIGYLDGQKLLYGLYGSKYYIDRSLSEREALDWLIRWLGDEEDERNLRRFLERELPLKAVRYGSLTGSYYELFAAVLESRAEKEGLEQFRIYGDLELANQLD